MAQSFTELSTFTKIKFAIWNLKPIALKLLTNCNLKKNPLKWTPSRRVPQSKNVSFITSPEDKHLKQVPS